MPSPPTIRNSRDNSKALSVYRVSCAVIVMMQPSLNIRRKSNSKKEKNERKSRKLIDQVTEYTLLTRSTIWKKRNASAAFGRVLTPEGSPKPP